MEHWVSDNSGFDTTDAHDSGHRRCQKLKKKPDPSRVSKYFSLGGSIGYL